MNRKFLCTAFVLLTGCVIAMADQTTPPISAPAKTVAATPAENAQPEFKFPALENPASWTMVIVPDTQTYIKQIENQGILDMMLAWIVRRREEMNIRQVLFTGDLVYHNNTGTIDQRKGVRFLRPGSLNDLVGEEQWKAYSRLMERLDGEVPYVLCTGNHDYGTFGSANTRDTGFGKYFPTDRNPLTRRQLVACVNNSFGKRTMECSAYEFTAPAPDGRKFLIITLPFAPNDGHLNWAKKIADTPRFADHFGIVLTHSYLNSNGEYVKPEKYVLSKQGGNAGEGIFQKLVYPAKNIRMVVCGHICAPDKWERSVCFNMTKNSSGKTVAQMMFNPQAIGGGFSGNGGDGWLRLLEFMPDGKTIKARTYSPFFGSSPSTLHLAWKQDERNEFTFVIE